MKTIITFAAAAALSLGLAGTAAANSPDATIDPKVSTEQGVAPAGCYYRYFYVTDGYQYRYFYRWYCY